MPGSRVVIIGGGAAGLSAAIAAAREGAAVTLLEGGARVGRKILASGNGRCNLTNLGVSSRAYNHPDFVEPTLAAFGCTRIRSFFDGLGLLTYADDEGRVYPVTNAATSVLDVLRLECAHLAVDERCGFEVARIQKTSGPTGLDVFSRGAQLVRADAVVVATGGGDSVLADLGHGRVECVPVLGPIKTELEPIRGLSGIRVRCAASVLLGAGVESIARERGELLFRDYGVSGIMIFDLSRYLAEGCVLSIDFFPDFPPEELGRTISSRCAVLSWRTAATFFDGMLHRRIAQAILRVAEIDLATPVTELPQAQLAALLKDYRLKVTGRGDAEQSQVTRGGVSVDGFDKQTMGSRIQDGVFAAGEVLDIDGRSGGFNLHWAWASGIIAGSNAARWTALAPHAGISPPETQRD